MSFLINCVGQNKIFWCENNEDIFKYKLCAIFCYPILHPISNHQPSRHKIIYATWIRTHVLLNSSERAVNRTEYFVNIFLTGILDVNLGTKQEQKQKHGSKHGPKDRPKDLVSILGLDQTQLLQQMPGIKV